MQLTLNKAVAHYYSDSSQTDISCCSESSDPAETDALIITDPDSRNDVIDKFEQDFNII